MKPWNELTVCILAASSTRSNWFFFPDLSGSTSWKPFGHGFLSTSFTIIEKFVFLILMSDLRKQVIICDLANKAIDRAIYLPVSWKFACRGSITVKFSVFWNPLSSSLVVLFVDVDMLADFSSLVGAEASMFGPIL